MSRLKKIFHCSEQLLHLECGLNSCACTFCECFRESESPVTKSKLSGAARILQPKAGIRLVIPGVGQATAVQLLDSS